MHDDKGMCTIHGMGKKMIRPGKKWTKGKNGLFYWKYTRQIYYICSGVSPSTSTVKTEPEPDEPVPTFLVLGHSASQRTSTRTNTTSVGQGATRANERLSEKKGPAQMTSMNRNKRR